MQHLSISRIIKIIILIKLSLFLSIFFSISTQANEKKPCFITTAYYSPLKGQKYYYNGSYYKEIKMNGEGHTTASGIKPFYGVLAGSKNYPFGTKVYLEGYGVGIIEDRGADIVKKGVRGDECDRIDIWMGYGDEGLWRALKWGKNKKIYGEIVSISNPVTLKFGKDILEGYKDLKINPEYNQKGKVKKLQELFTKLGLYKGKIDDKYSSIKQTLINFQLKNKLISSKYDDAAGRYGPKTVTKLIKLYGTEPLIKEKSKPKLIPLSKKVKTILAYNEVYLDGDNPESKDVKKVQELFKYLGLYNGKIDGKFTSLKPEFIKFQKSLGLIKTDKSWGAGYYGSTTKRALIKYFEEKDIKINKINHTYTKLNKKDKKILDKAGKTLISYIEKKSKGNKYIKKTLKNNFIKRIDKLRKKTKNKSNKIKLEYLKNLITIKNTQDNI